MQWIQRKIRKAEDQILRIEKLYVKAMERVRVRLVNDFMSTLQNLQINIKSVSKIELV